MYQKKRSFSVSYQQHAEFENQQPFSRELQVLKAVWFGFFPLQDMYSVLKLKEAEFAWETNARTTARLLPKADSTVLGLRVNWQLQMNTGTTQAAIKRPNTTN